MQDNIYTKRLAEAAQTEERRRSINTCSPEELAKWEAGTEQDIKLWHIIMIWWWKMCPSTTLTLTWRVVSEKTVLPFCTGQRMPWCATSKYERTNLRLNIDKDYGSFGIGCAISGKCRKTEWFAWRWWILFGYFVYVQNAIDWKSYAIMIIRYINNLFAKR